MKMSSACTLFSSAHNPNNYERALMSAPPQAIAPNPHTNLLNVYTQIANKMGFQQTNKKPHRNRQLFEDSAYPCTLLCYVELFCILNSI
jgi:hypothetical protein